MQGAFHIYAGWLVAYSHNSHCILAAYPNLRQFAVQTLLPASLLAGVVHSQMVYERVGLINQIGNLQVLVLCTLGQAILTAVYMQWMFAVALVKVCARVCICARASACVPLGVCMHVCMYVGVSILGNTHCCVHAVDVCCSVSQAVYVQACVCLCVREYIYVYVYIDIYMYIYRRLEPRRHSLLCTCSRCLL